MEDATSAPTVRQKGLQIARAKGEALKINSGGKDIWFTKEEMKLIWSFWCYCRMDSSTKDVAVPITELERGVPVNYMAKAREAVPSPHDPKFKNMKFSFVEPSMSPKLIGEIVHLRCWGESGYTPADAILNVEYLVRQNKFDPPPHCAEVERPDKATECVGKVKDSYKCWHDKGGRLAEAKSYGVIETQMWEDKRS